MIIGKEIQNKELGLGKDVLLLRNGQDDFIRNHIRELRTDNAGLESIFLVYRYAHLARHYVIDLLAVFQNQFRIRMLEHIHHY